MPENSDTISREAAKNALCQLCRDISNWRMCDRNDECNLICRIDGVPAADVLPVVFCRDCKNSYEWANVDGDNYRYCGYLRSRWNHDTDRMVYDGDYCKWGRKREES